MYRFSPTHSATLNCRCSAQLPCIQQCCLTRESIWSLSGRPSRLSNRLEGTHNGIDACNLNWHPVHSGNLFDPLQKLAESHFGDRPSEPRSPLINFDNGRPWRTSSSCSG